MKINAKTKLCIIIGDPVDHSLSPAMHNAGYEALGINDKFVYIAANVKVENVKDVIKAMRVMGFRGLTCTIPHKIEVIKYLDKIDPIAEKIGAVNTVVNDGGVLIGYNTDWLGVVIPLEKETDLTGKKAAIIGAGGAARAMAYGLIARKSKVTIFNRTFEKGRNLAHEIGGDCNGCSMENIDEAIGDFDIILNATSLGMGKNVGLSPISKSKIKSHQIVFDAVYVPYETQLLLDAGSVGATAIHGTEMLLHQGIAQFELYTGQKAPEEVMRKALNDQLSKAV